MNENIVQILWMVAIALAVVAVLQILHLIFLGLTMNRRSEPQRPAQPIMPTQPPASMVTTQTTPYVSPAPPAPGMGPVMPAAAAPAVTGSQPVQPAVYRAMPTAGSVGKFVILSGLTGQREVPLPSSSFVIGRFYSPENNVLMAMDEKSISRKHAQFFSDEQIREYYLVDSSSTYGTFLLLGGQFEQLKPEKQERVYNEDVVQFGNNVRVRLILPCETRSSTTRL